MAWKATEQDFETASAFGVNIDRAVASNFFLGSAVARAAGVLVGFYYNSVYPTMGSVPAYKAMAIAVMGGLGNVWGTVDRIPHLRPCGNIPCHIPAGVYTSPGLHRLCRPDISLIVQAPRPLRTAVSSHCITLR